VWALERLVRGTPRKRLAVWVIAASAVSAAAPVSGAVANSELSQATQTLRLSIDEWKREDAAYRRARSAGKIPRVEQESYAVFVAGLRLRVLEQCEVVRGLGGEAAVARFECVRVGPEEQRAGAVAVAPPAAVLTDEEKKAAVHARLDRIEGDIDESLQKRQQEIRQTAIARGSGAGGGGRGAGGTGGSAGSTGSSGGASSSASTGTWSPPDAKKSPGDSGADAEKGARTDSPDQTASRGNEPQGAARQHPTDGGADDDIVARQLREAAEKETDPVLKERLWEEYRKYKEAKR
jgi:hypothetical protein